jgi:hypothetical protein
MENTKKVYVCTIPVTTILDIAISYWELKKDSWKILGNNIAYRNVETHESICVYTYPNERARISYSINGTSKSAWIHTNVIGDQYYLTPRTPNL